VEGSHFAGFVAVGSVDGWKLVSFRWLATFIWGKTVAKRPNLAGRRNELLDNRTIASIKIKLRLIQGLDELGKLL
jgi:hypothetical protein